MTQDISEVVVSETGITFAGPDAVKLFQAISLRSGLKMLQCGLRPHQGFTYKRAFAVAKRFTGRDYKRSEVQIAVNDLTVWIETMKSALPARAEGKRGSRWQNSTLEVQKNGNGSSS